MDATAIQDRVGTAVVGIVLVLFTVWIFWALAEHWGIPGRSAIGVMILLAALDSGLGGDVHPLLAILLGLVGVAVLKGWAATVRGVMTLIVHICYPTRTTRRDWAICRRI